MIGELAPAPEATIAWKVHLLAERPVRGVLALALIVAVLLFLHLSGDDGFLPIAALIFFVTLAPFYFPTYYQLGSAGVTRRVALVTTTRRWEEFRNFYHDDETLKLSTFSGRSRLEPFRGLSIRFAGNRDEVIAYVAGHVKRNV